MPILFSANSSTIFSRKFFGLASPGFQAPQKSLAKVTPSFQIFEQECVSTPISAYGGDQPLFLVVLALCKGFSGTSILRRVLRGGRFIGGALKAETRPFAEYDPLCVHPAKDSFPSCCPAGKTHSWTNASLRGNF